MALGALPKQSASTPVGAPVPGGNVVPFQPPSATAPPPTMMGPGLMRATPLATLQANSEAAQREADARQNQPFITGLAGHVRSMFTTARDAKRLEVEPRMIQNLRAYRGEYDPDILAKIKEMGGSEAYAGLTGLKCRAAASWIKDVMMTTGSERPWTISPTPVADLPPEMNELIVNEASKPIMAALAAGQDPGELQTVSMLSMMRDQALGALQEEAIRRAERMADKMEDQLQEGNFYTGLDQFIDDLTIYPTAFLKGPVIRMKARLTWGPNSQPVVAVKLVKEWERVDPFKIYPSPAASCVEDGYLIEKHRLSRKDLQQLKGVTGYDDGAIDMVLRDFGQRGLDQWLFDTSEQAQAEGRPTSILMTNPDGLIDALQYWGSVQGQLLLDWGMKDKTIEPRTEYDVECWVIGPYVIKAMLNPDPLGRRPYYATSYAKVAGSLWGQSVADLVRDPQIGCNAALRAMINNAALSSGPQVGVLADRLAPGEDVTQMFPWKIWQLKSDDMSGGSYQPPITFFQPASNVNDLMLMYDKFMTQADEFSGIPRYMTGGSATGGAGRTASGLSMLMTNAGKVIKAVIGNIDLDIWEEVLERLYYYNMRYEDDPELKGDICVVARGAEALIAKESAQVRRNEFLATTANPIDMEIVGVEGRAAILREVAKGLDMDVNKVVPPIALLRQRWQAKQALAAGAAGPPAGPPGMAPPPGPGATENNQQTLTDGSPIADTGMSM